jgi:hypothetical protein
LAQTSDMQGRTATETSLGRQLSLRDILCDPEDGDHTTVG